MKLKTLSILLTCLTLESYAQESAQWTDADRKYLIDNLIRSKEELLKETEGLSKTQWSFKESPDRWSINEIVEHIAIWELLLDHQVSRSLRPGPHPEFSKDAGEDKTYLDFIMEEKKHHSPEYTKPFTYTVPMGLNDIKSNIAWFTKMRDESIKYVASTQDDLRVYFLSAGSKNVHQTYITLFGHTDRHLRQIKKVKQHPQYPKV